MFTLFCLKFLCDQIVLIVNLLSYLSVDIGARDLLEDLRFSAFVAFEELRELTLGEHGCAAELVEVKSYCCCDDSSNLLIIGIFLSRYAYSSVKIGYGP